MSSRGFYRLVLGAGQEDMMQMQMGMGMGMGMGGMGGAPMGGNNFDAAAAFKQERSLMQLNKHKWVGDSAEQTLLGARYPTAAGAGSRSAGSDDLIGLMKSVSHHHHALSSCIV